MSRPGQWFVRQYIVDPEGEGPDEQRDYEQPSRAAALKYAKRLRVEVLAVVEVRRRIDAGWDRSRLLTLLSTAEREQCPNDPTCLMPDERGVSLHVRDWCGVCCLVADIRELLGHKQSATPFTPATEKS